MPAVCNYFRVSYRLSSPFYHWMLLQAIVLFINGLFFWTTDFSRDLQLFLVGAVVVFLGLQGVMYLRMKSYLDEYPAVPIRCTETEKFRLMDEWNERTDYYQKSDGRHRMENYIFTIAVVIYEAIYLLASK